MAMRRTARLFRLCLVVLATVQVAAPAGAALADAVVDPLVPGQHEHQGNPQHDNCIFCQFLGQAAVASHATAQPQPATHIEYALPALFRAPVRSFVHHLPDPRAPPLS
jgi:hypothetical protein